MKEEEDEISEDASIRNNAEKEYFFWELIADEEMEEKGIMAEVEEEGL